MAEYKLMNLKQLKLVTNAALPSLYAVNITVGRLDNK